MTPSMNPRRSALVLVDYQERLLPQIHRGAEALALGAKLGRVAQLLGVPVLGTEQNPRGLGPNAADVRALCSTTLSKMHFDGCRDGLLELLQHSSQPAPEQVVVAGCEAHVCLLQTTLGLLRAGLTVWVVADACGSRLASNHELAMQRLRAAGAHVVSFEMVAFEWLQSCEHPQFKAVLQVLKAS
jgi:nicotinamidase-related amidase